MAIRSYGARRTKRFARGDRRALPPGLVARIEPLLNALDRADTLVDLDLRPLASLQGLRQLSVRHNLLDDLQPLAGLAGLDIGDNRVKALRPLAGLDGLRRQDLRGSWTRDLRALGGLPSLVWVHVGGSRIEDLTALESLDGLTVEGQDDLESLAPGEGRVQRSGSPDLGSAGQ